MNIHRHLSTEEIFESISAGKPAPGVAGCESCEAEASSLSHLLGELRRTDAEGVAATDWDDLLLRRRIREALAKERPHLRSIFDRFAILRPVLASALIAALAFAVWSPVSRYGDSKGTQVASTNLGRLPSWSPLPVESEDEGRAILAEWTPNEDELAIAGCRAACLSGLSNHEEEDLLLAVASIAATPPIAGATPL